MVLSVIGVSIAILALVRDWPLPVLAGVAVAMLGLHPLLDVSMLPTPLRAVIYSPVREGAFRSLYPIVPWFGLVLLGFVVGRDALGREKPGRLWLALAAASLVAFFAIRLAGGYGNAYPHDGLGAQNFWYFAKYPPDLPFLTWSLANVFAFLAALEWLCRRGVPRFFEPFVVFGRVPFFFYLVHFYVLGVAQPLLGTEHGLGEAYLIWLALLALMLWPCAWYYRKKRERPNLVTRYL